MPKPWGPTTTAIHAGKRFNTTRAVTTPIFQTSVFQLMENSEGAEFSASVEPPAFYTRWGNPNTSEVEAVLAELEGAERALATASGMAAFALVFEALLKPGDHLVAPAAIYLGTEQLIRRWEAERGLKVTWVQNTLDLAEWEAALQPETRMIWVETPSNPTLALTDLAGVAALGKKHGVRTVADNTFPSPIHTRPLAFGIDLSVASATKYLGGHSDLVAGVIAGPEADIVACWHLAKILGPTLDPMASWLLHRGLKTLALRVRRASDNAQALAQWLLWQPHVARVDYPGLPSHPGHEIAVRQMEKGYGAMVGFELRAGLVAGQRFCEALEVITRGVSLGGVESLIQHPASMSHLKTAPEVKARLGITDGLLRFSVGIEDQPDLIADLEKGFQAAAVAR
ncbi:MAG: PLP-dependent transferase [Geothrix sp.]|uniref:trans-sulfuration enzyme family protein n=1 Tax=Geothrix sp. TaxID=1962974 RepID=UPI0017A0C410|nr:PLP-dependent aspartate aminotransferase family protein [Geothrix sp.]NWJ41247.1 PLP-dependent transferase [Geothrix sp.]WIL20762.1 MAG: PLP-dependent aspartate aminotransferase family protein [Geothrix sp.]